MQYRLFFLFTVWSMIFCIVVRAQNNQFTITSDNDSYFSINNDGYYTNGIKLGYQWRISKPQKKKTTRINIVEAGQNIYTARFSGEAREEKLDRPIAGYLYARFGQTLYNEKEDLLRWGITGGLVGPSSRGAQLQKLVHKFLNIYEPTYWDRQIREAWGANADVTWSPQIGNSASSKWNFKPVLTATGGTLAAHAGAGAALLFGKFNKNSSSAFWNNYKATGKRQSEFFGFIHPMVYGKAYDATVQGGMFNKATEAIEGKLNPLFFQGQLGGVYANNRLSISVIAIYENKQSLTQTAPQYYGRVQFGWIW